MLLFGEHNNNAVYGLLLFTRGKVYQDVGESYKFEQDIKAAKLVYENCVYRGGGDFSTLRLAACVKEIGNNS